MQVFPVSALNGTGFDAWTSALEKRMMYNNEYVNDTVSMYGSRHLPTAVIVKGGN